MVKLLTWADIGFITDTEWERVCAEVPNIPVEQKTFWWADHDFSANPDEQIPDGSPCVFPDGKLGYVYSYDIDELGIRPLFTINGYCGEPGTKMEIGRTVCTVIKNENSPIGTVAKVLSDTILFTRKYTGIKEFINKEIFHDLVLAGGIK